MLRYKASNKQAFIIAALIILICLVCLSGATYALFTSSSEDGTIGIVTTSGSVSIDIVDTSGATLRDKSLEFIVLSGSSEPTFEPGATFYTQGFQVKNLGNIPVNFSLYISKDEKIDMSEFEEAFDVWIVRVDDENFANAERITNFKGRLEVGQSSDTYCLFIKMKETAGNDFQGKSYTGIGVTVYAVQGNVDIGD